MHLKGNDPHGEQISTNIEMRNNSPGPHYGVAMRILEHQRDLEDGISSYTQKKNMEVKNQIFQSNKIIADEEERTYKFKYTTSIDCNQIMRKFNSEFTTLNYQLKRLVCDKDSH